ncbi:MAG: hypothetical protein OHK0046_34010 [Anaerolineae bacterium]
MSRRSLLLVLLMVAFLSTVIITPAAFLHAASATFTVTTVADGDDATPGDGVCATSEDVCTLRAAIQEANANDGTDTVEFNIDTGVQTMKFTSTLPVVTDPIIIDGTTQPGYADKPLIVLDGSAVTEPSDAYYQDGLKITAGSSTVKGLVIIKFGGVGLFLDENGNNVVEGNYFGLTAAGTSGAGNGNDGIRLEENSNTQILNNVISDNDWMGINLSDSSNVVIQGNIIGLTAAGTNPLGNAQHGIYITTWNSVANNITIGGAEAGQRNVIADNGREGIMLQGNLDGTQNLVIQGNYIGTDIGGNLDRGNHENGIYLYNGADITVGGTAAGEGNLISGNESDGITLSSGESITIYGNTIGTNASGNAPLGNGDSGVNVFNAPSQVLIGGSTEGMGNIISANTWYGILLFDTPNVLVQGNFIGTNPAGGALGNLRDGVYLDYNTDSTIVGGIEPNEGNFIAFNNRAGVKVYGRANAIRGNTIVANVEVGIDLRIPGVAEALSSPGVTPNDFGDGDTGGNNLQNFPIITSASVDGANLVIEGTLNSSYVTSFSIDVYISGSCDAAGNGEGTVYLGSANNVQTDEDGDASFSLTVPAPSAGTIITATATDSGNNTSEFSACVTIQGTGTTPTATPTSTPTVTASPEGPTATPTATATTDPNGPTATATSTTDPNEPTPTSTATTPAAGIQRLAPAANAVISQAGDYASQFQWSPVQGAEWYHVFVSTPDFSQIFFDKWYLASEVCNGSVCTTKDDIWLVGSGQISWWMTYWSQSIGMDYLNLYQESRFTLSLPQPGDVTGGQPSGNVANGNITAQWNTEPSTLWYQVWIGPADYSATQFLLWVNGADVCAGATCTVQVPGTLPNGDYELWIQTWNPTTTTDWQKLSEFTVGQ